MYGIPDNYSAWEQHEADKERRLDRLPRCSECGEPIQDEHCYEVNDELICPDCMESNHRKWVEDVVDL